LVRSAAKDAHSAVSRLGKADAGADSGGGVKMATAALGDVIDVCDELQAESGGYVVWLAPPDGDYEAQTPARILAAPLNVASLIGERLLVDKPAVFTSATLALGGGFDTVARHLGVENPTTLDAG